MAFYEATTHANHTNISVDTNTKCILETYSDTTQIWLLNGENAVKFPPNAFPITYTPREMNPDSTCTYCNTTQPDLMGLIGAEDETVPPQLLREFGVTDFPTGLYMVQICSNCISAFNEQADHLWNQHESEIFLDQL